MNASELRERRKSGEKITATTTEKVKYNPRRIAARMYELTPYRITVENGVVTETAFPKTIVSANARAREIAVLKRKGFARVDCIEIRTTVNEPVNTMTVDKYTVKTTTKFERRKLEFAEQIFAAAKNKYIPKAIAIEPVSAAQTTIPWETISNTPNAYLSDKPLIKVKDRLNKARTEEKRYRLFNKLNNVNSDRMAIFDRKSGGFLFASEDFEEILNFFQTKNLVLENTILYVANDLYWMLRELEG